MFSSCFRLYIFAESTPRNCEPCGTNLIPYPLSTGTNCGDPMYFSFYCSNFTGQVHFKTPNGTYPVASIDPGTRKFVILVRYAGKVTNTREILHLNTSFPFNATGQFTRDSDNYYSYEVEISWEPPKEPTCTSSKNCTDWPNSTCNVTRDGKGRCHCKGNFLWDGSKLKCTKGLEDYACFVIEERIRPLRSILSYWCVCGGITRDGKRRRFLCTRNFLSDVSNLNCT